MKKSLLFPICIITLLIFSIRPVYSINEPYRSIANGNWSDVGIWELYNGTLWVPATFPPSSVSGTININHNVTLNYDLEVDQLTVSDTLIIGTSIIMTLVDGPGTDLTNIKVILGPGNIRTQGSDVTIALTENANGCYFKPDLLIDSGGARVKAAYFTSFDLNCNLTIDSGSTFSIYPGHSLKAYNDILNNGIIDGSNNSVYFHCPTVTNNGSIINGLFYEYGSTFINNGITNTGLGFYLTNCNIFNNGIVSDVASITGSCNFQGAGFFGNVSLSNSSTITITSNIRISKVKINPGTVFDISNHTLFVSADFNQGTVITNNGTLITTNSTIEYNGTAIQNIVTNINYKNLRINNPAGVRLFGNDLDINDTLSLISGDLTMYSAIITLPTFAYLKETPGNTITGSGYITTTRALNAPLNLNVGGLGAIITSSSDLGSTEIRRYNATQNNVNGSTSILRYYDITPTNNSGLNASLIYKYDDSELNGKPESSLQLFRSTNSGSTWTFRGGNTDTSANEISLSGIDAFSRWTAGGGYLTSQIKIIPEGFYNVVNGKMNSKDTVRAFLRNISLPYIIVDSAKSVVDSITFTGNFTFINAPSGTYYIEVKHRNSIETWSKSGGETYSLGNVFTYDFTNGISQAFGNNMVLKGSKSCIYSGDPNQDGSVDATDVLEIYNDANSFSNGYVSSDLTGDKIVDVTDILISYNNSGNFVGKLTP